MSPGVNNLPLWKSYRNFKVVETLFLCRLWGPTPHVVMKRSVGGVTSREVREGGDGDSRLSGDSYCTGLDPRSLGDPLGARRDGKGPVRRKRVPHRLHVCTHNSFDRHGSASPPAPQCLSTGTAVPLHRHGSVHRHRACTRCVTSTDYETTVLVCSGDSRPFPGSAFVGRGGVPFRRWAK